MLDLFHDKYIYIYIYSSFLLDLLLHVVTSQMESGDIVAKESVSKQTESMEMSVDKHDISVRFDYLIPSTGTMHHHHNVSF